MRDDDFKSECLFNQRGPFDSLEDRFAMITATPTWEEGAKAGNLAVYENLKVRK